MIHNHEVPGSIPGPATPKASGQPSRCLFFLLENQSQKEKFRGINHPSEPIKNPLTQASHVPFKSSLLGSCTDNSPELLYSTFYAIIHFLTLIDTFIVDINIRIVTHKSTLTYSSLFCFMRCFCINRKRFRTGAKRLAPHLIISIIVHIVYLIRHSNSVFFTCIGSTDPKHDGHEQEQYFFHDCKVLTPTRFDTGISGHSVFSAKSSSGHAHKKSVALIQHTPLSKVFGVTQANKIMQKAHAAT